MNENITKQNPAGTVATEGDAACGICGCVPTVECGECGSDVCASDLALHLEDHEDD